MFAEISGSWKSNCPECVSKELIRDHIEDMEFWFPLMLMDWLYKIQQEIFQHQKGITILDQDYSISPE